MRALGMPLLARLLIALAVGIATGVLTLALQGVLPVEANRLANSGAIWVTVAFLLGWWVGEPRAAVVAGLLALIGALVGYFVAAKVGGYGVSTSTVAIWTVVAVLGGPVFGLAGCWRSGPRGRLATIGIALLGAVYLAEGISTLLNIPHMALAGWVSCIAGVVLIVILARDRAERLAALAWAVPLTALGTLGYALIDRAFLSV